MPKQLYVALPCAAARRAMLERALGPSGGVHAALAPADLAKVVEKTAGYSGAPAGCRPAACWRWLVCFLVDLMRAPGMAGRCLQRGWLRGERAPPEFGLLSACCL